MNTELDRKIMKKSLKISSFIVFMLLFLMATFIFIATPLILNAVIQQTENLTIGNIIIVTVIILLGHLINTVSIFLKNFLKRNYFVETITKLYIYVFKLTYDRYLDEGPSVLQNKSHLAISAYTDFYFETIPSLIVNLIIVIASTIMAFIVNPLVAIIMFSILPFNYFGYKLLNKKLSILSVEMSKVCSEAWADENTLISQVDFIKQNAKNEKLLPLINNYRFKSQEITRKVNNYANGFSKILISINQVVNNLLILILASMMFVDANAVSGAILVMLVLPYFTSSVSGITSANLSFVDINTANEFISELAKNAEENGKFMIEEINKIDINIDKISIKNNILLENVNLSLKKGEVIGIFGESGSGKSTLAKLLVKFRKSRGIYINDIPITDIENISYFDLTSYYSQNTPIITGTVYKNLDLGREPSNEEEYKKLPFLSKFKNFNELILENGANLSGGDRQRIALARYFTENSQLVILDEPTNSLDEHTEKEILSSIFSLSSNKIVLLISHNLENMKYCSQVYEIKDKKLVKMK